MNEGKEGILAGERWRMLLPRGYILGKGSPMLPWDSQARPHCQPGTQASIPADAFGNATCTWATSLRHMAR